jgi:hypothetical protein
MYISNLEDHSLPRDENYDAWEHYIRNKYEYKRFMNPSIKVSFFLKWFKEINL